MKKIIFAGIIGLILFFIPAFYAFGGTNVVSYTYALSDSNNSNNDIKNVPSTIYIKGQAVPYVENYNGTSAPIFGAGIWKGTSSTTDNRYSYFVGHNPGPFHNVMDLDYSDVISVCDKNRNSKDYSVIEIFEISNQSTFEDVYSHIPEDECIVVQTCIGNGDVRIVIAQ